MFIGIANPIPSTDVSAYLDELIPITAPDESTSAPPLFPGLIAASVWRSFIVLSSPDTSLSFALIYPTVTEVP